MILGDGFSSIKGCSNATTYLHSGADSVSCFLMNTYHVSWNGKVFFYFCTFVINK